MNSRHIIISRAWFEDKALMEKYLAVASKVLIPALKAQTCQDFEFGIILKSEDIDRFREVLAIEFTPFSGMDDFKGRVLSGKYNIQTRQDIDDWISETYVETIQRLFKETSFRTMVIHAHPVKMTYPAGEESEMREYSGKHTSMFLSLCQHEVNHTVFDKQHGMMYTLADKVIKLEKGYARWVQHSDSVSNTRDKVRGVKMLSGPDNILHTWVDKPPKLSDEVKVEYNNGKIKTHRRRYANDLVKMGIARIIEEETSKNLVVKMPVLNQDRVIDYDKEYKIGVVIVCYETPELIKRAVNSVLGVEGLRVMIVDNSHPGSECYKVCDNFAADDNVDVIHTGRNIFHGPGLHLGIENLSTEYVCVMDSDAEVIDTSVFEKMIKVLQDDSIYAVGGYVEKIRNSSRLSANLYGKREFDYLKPWFAIFKIRSYYQFSPFIHHGAPWCQTMIDIKGKKRVVQLTNTKSQKTAVDRYVKHKGMQTYGAAKGTWLKGWQNPIDKKFLDVLMICFVYNEIKYLPHVIDFWKNQGVDVYVIDNMSNDGTWEWLQKQKISSHRFDTKDMFHLDWLQAELTKTLHKIKPDWVIYGAADLYYGFGEPIKNVIQKAHNEGYNQIKTACWFGVNTGEKRKLPLIENYFWCKPFTSIVMISKYDKNIRFAGDHIHLPERKIMDAKGIILNYGSCKSPEEQEIKLKRRQEAWDAGMTKTYGSHYRLGKQLKWIYDRQELIDIRRNTNKAYLDKILELCG